MTEKKKNVFIVDDIVENLQVLSNILKPRGVNISFARNGMDAISGIAKKKPDIILLDVAVPGMNGFEVCAKLKEDEATSKIPVIFLTAKTEPEDIVEGFNHGGVDYITKPFHAEELLARVFTHLELQESRNIIAKQNEDLRKKTRELEALNATKDKFFNIIAHDLKGPLSGIVNLTHLILDQSANYDTEQILQLIQKLKDSGVNTFRLLENLLNWSLSQTGHLDYEPGYIDLYEIGKEILELTYNAAIAKNINVLTMINKKSMVYADRNMIFTVLRNLVNNALKYTDHDGEVMINAETVDDKMQVCVQDTGVGISAENITKLFHIENSFSTKGTQDEIGSGLGLILCKEFVERNGGRIWVESEVGKGSCFMFTVPVVEKKIPEKQVLA